MKRKARVKLLVCYILAAVLMLVLLNTYGQNRMEKKLLEQSKDVLYHQAELIVGEYAMQYYASSLSYQAMSMLIQTQAKFLNRRIILMNTEGKVILDSEYSLLGINLTDRVPEYLERKFTSNLLLRGYIQKPMLSATIGISYDYSLRGYLSVLMPMDEISENAVYYVDFINMVYLVFLVILSVIFIFIYFFAINPVRKLQKIAKEYAQGHFDKKLVLHSHDEYRELLDTIEYMADELKSLDDYQKKFVGNISHDFRSPLTSIRGYAEAILDGTIPYEMQNKYLDIILFETDRLTKLTTNLLSLNSFDQKGAMLDIRSFDIAEVIRKTAATFEGYCTKKRIVLNLVFSARELYVDADKDKIQQVLYNLLDNAIKFSNLDSKIQVTAEEKGAKIIISVKDHGIGIPKESLKRIWERFYKTDTSRGKDKKGTGLGLSIAKEIIQAHQENINVISTEGVGTEFIFSLPKSD